MARFLKGKKLPAMTGIPVPGPAPMPPMRGGLPGGGGMMGPAPVAPKPKPRRFPVMKRKGVALSGFAPGAKPAPKKIRKPKLPIM